MEQGPAYNSINFILGGANVGGVGIPYIPYPGCAGGARVEVNQTAFVLL